VGFIAEDVPKLVATKNRKGMSAMDVVAVLTKVVQKQQRTIAELSRKVDKLENRIKIQKDPLILSYKMMPRND
jgi:cell division protein FtsB